MSRAQRVQGQVGRTKTKLAFEKPLPAAVEPLDMGSERVLLGAQVAAGGAHERALLPGAVHS